MHFHFYVDSCRHLKTIYTLTDCLKAICWNKCIAE
nr:MAG TPA: Mitochondrial import inner membrane translocase-Propeller Helix-Turn-Helix Intramolecular.5A [Bacteriophage sp.]